MQNTTDREYLRGQQYRTASNLNARMELHARFSTNKCGWHRWMFDQLALVEGMRVLEIGCGPGTLWTENADRVPPGCRIILTDLSEGMVGQSRENLAPHTFLDSVALVDAQALPFIDGAFDIVVANHMLYHVPNRPRAIAEFARVLASGGTLFAATNGNGHMDELYGIAKEFDNDAVDRGAPSHAGFSLENGREQLAQTFDNVECALFDDGLRVTEAYPLIAYLLSGFVKEGASTDGWQEALDKRIAREGSINITKSAGAFIARKA